MVSVNALLKNEGVNFLPETSAEALSIMWLLFGRRQTPLSLLFQLLFPASIILSLSVRLWALSPLMRI